MTATSTNGSARAAVFQLLDGDGNLTREELSAALGGTPGPRQCGNLRREWKEARAAQLPQEELPALTPQGTAADAPGGTQAAIPATQTLPREEPPARALTTRRTATQRRARPPVAPAGTDDRPERWARLLVSWAVAGIALLMSYSHVRHLATMAGIGWPGLLPLSIDGLMFAGWLCHRRHPWYPLAVTSVALGVAGSAALNAIAARPELADMADVRLGAAIAVPISAVVALHLALKR